MPASLRRGEIPQAVEVLKMLTQDEVRREMYEAREKARRDAASWQSALDRWKQEVDRAKKEAATSRARGELIGQIQAFQYVLGQEQTPDDQLTAMSLDELKSLVHQLRSQLNGDEQSRT